MCCTLRRLGGEGGVSLYFFSRGISQKGKLANAFQENGCRPSSWKNTGCKSPIRAWLLSLYVQMSEYVGHFGLEITQQQSDTQRDITPNESSRALLETYEFHLTLIHICFICHNNFYFKPSEWLQSHNPWKLQGHLKLVVRVKLLKEAKADKQILSLIP